MAGSSLTEQAIACVAGSGPRPTPHMARSEPKCSHLPPTPMCLDQGYICVPLPPMLPLYLDQATLPCPLLAHLDRGQSAPQFTCLGWSCFAPHTPPPTCMPLDWGWATPLHFYVWIWATLSFSSPPTTRIQIGAALYLWPQQTDQGQAVPPPPWPDPAYRETCYWLCSLQGEKVGHPCARIVALY